MKPTRAHEPNEPMLLENLARFLSPEDYPVFVEKKYDGARVIIHRVGDRIKIYSDDGEDVTARFPQTNKRLLALKGDYILSAEVEAWVDGKHYPREYVGGYLGAKGRLEDEAQMVFNCFSLLWRNGEDLTKQEEAERRRLLEQFKFDQSTMGIPARPFKLNLAPAIQARNDREMLRVAKRILQTPAAEGIVVKKHSAIYYLDGNSREGWFKWHVNVVFPAIILEPRETKTPGVFNYRIGIDPEDFSIRPADLEEVKDKEFLEIATTFSTEEKYDRGQVIEVNPETVNLIFDARRKTLRITTWVTRTLRAVPGKPFSVTQLVQAAKQERCLSVKMIDEKGETHYLQPEDAERLLRQARK
jgi:hypothetical protein